MGFCSLRGPCTSKDRTGGGGVGEGIPVRSLARGLGGDVPASLLRSAVDAFTAMQGIGRSAEKRNTGKMGGDAGGLVWPVLGPRVPRCIFFNSSMSV